MVQVSHTERSWATGYQHVDVERAYSRDASLVPEASGGRTQRVMRALLLEAEIRADPEHLADRFVEKWQKLDRDYHAAYAQGDYGAARRARDTMGAMAKASNATRRWNPYCASGATGSASISIPAASLPMISPAAWASRRGAARDSRPIRRYAMDNASQPSQPEADPAGIRSMSADSPAAWQSIVQAMQLRRDNGDAIDGCRDRAAKARHAVSCALMIQRSSRRG